LNKEEIKVRKRSVRSPKPKIVLPTKRSVPDTVYIKDPSFMEDLFMTEIWNSAIDTRLIFRIFYMIILTLVGIVSHIIRVPTEVYEVIAFIFIAIFGIVVYGSLKEIKESFLKSRAQYRLRLRLIGSDEYFQRYINDCQGKNVFIPDKSGIPFEQMVRDIRAIKLRKALKSVRPEGVAGNKPSLREVRINMGKVEARSKEPVVPISAKRPHVSISLDGSKPVTALLDSGANSCLISKEYLRRLETSRESRFPRIRSGLRVSGLNSTEENSEVVLIDIKIDNKIPISKVPFIVCEMSKEVLIGLNLIRTCNLTMSWRGEELTNLTFNVNSFKGKLNVIYDDDVSIRAVSCHKVTVQPGEMVGLTLEIPGTQRHRLGELRNQKVGLIPSEEFRTDTSKGLEFIETFTKVRRNKVQGCLVNTSKEPVTIPKGIALGEVVSTEEDMEGRIHIQEFKRASKLVQEIKWITPGECICEKSLQGDVIHLVDNNGYSPLRLSPLESEMNLSFSSYDPFKSIEHGVIIHQSRHDPERSVVSLVPDERGSYSYDNATFRNIGESLRSKAQYFLLDKSVAMNSWEIRLLIYKLKRVCPDLKIVNTQGLRKKNFHLRCVGISDTLPKSMFKNATKGVILLQLMRGVSFHPDVNDDCTPIDFEIL